MDEHRILTPRSARYLTLGNAAAGEVWFALHGYGQLAARFGARFSGIAGGGRFVVVPEGLSRHYVDHPRGLVGASWMTREDRTAEIADYVRYLDGVLAETAKTGGTTTQVLGFSQGSATACRWVALGAVRPQRLILWGGELPPDLDWAQARPRFQALREVLLVAGDTDPFATPKMLRRYADILSEHDVRHRTVTYPGDHSVDPAMLATLAEDFGPA